MLIMKGESMSQFNPEELASYGKHKTKAPDSQQRSNAVAKKLPIDTLITHHGEILGEFSSISEDVRCDCPDGTLHSDGRGDSYAHTIMLPGGEVGISCSGDSCNGLFIPDTPISKVVSSRKLPTQKLDIGQLDTIPLLHFTEDMIPEPIRRWTLDICQQCESSLNYGAVSSVIVIANIIGYRCRIRPKPNTDWKLSVNLWGMLIGDPSYRKSPVATQCIAPLKRLQKEAYEEYEKKKTDYESQKMLKDIAEKAKKSALQKAYETSDEKAIERAEQMSVPLLEEPISERFIMNDATTEAVGVVASKNTRTILQYRDELSGFFSTFRKSGREGDRAFYLEAFQGDASYTYDRIGRGNIHIEMLSIGVFGTIQPSVLAQSIIPQNGKNNDGLSQRMQLSVFSDGEQRPYYDSGSKSETKTQVYDIMKSLAYADYEVMVGAKNDPDDSIPYFQFDNAAQDIYIEWYNNLKKKEHDESDENIQAHIGKYYSLLPSLALVFFLIDKVSGRIDTPSIGVDYVELAIQWCTVLESHARKMYSLTDQSSKKNLPQKIIDYVTTHHTELPKSFGEISGNIRGANSEAVEEALKGIAEIDGRKVIKLLLV